MTSDLMDYFFNRRTNIFSTLSREEIRILHTIYDLPEYRRYLPPLPKEAQPVPMQDRAHRRFPVRCPARLRIERAGLFHSVASTVYECSEKVFCAHVERPLSVGLGCEAEIDLGESERCVLLVEVLRLSKHSNRMVMFRIRSTANSQGKHWLKFVRALSNAATAADLEEATRFYDESTPA